MIKSKCTVVAFLATSFSVCAQSLVVPAVHGATDGDSSAPLAGISYRGREQVVIGPAHLMAMRGKVIDGLWLRRDSSRLDTLLGGTTSLQVRISETSIAPERAAPVFASNHGPVIVVAYQGPVSVPASPPAGSDLWAVDQTIRIAFTAPVSYGGGNLCVEIECASSDGASSKWPIDCAREAVASRIVTLGAHCSTSAELVGTRMLTANPDALAIGATTALSVGGRYGTVAALMLGVEIAGGLDLTSIGMTGCTWYVQPAATFTSILAARPSLTPPWETAFTNFQFTIPFDSSLLSGTFVVQAADVEVGSQYSNPLGVALSEGLRLTLAPAAPSLGMTTVESLHVDDPAPLPTEGIVINNRAPVLKLFYH